MSFNGRVVVHFGENRFTQWACIKAPFPFLKTQCILIRCIFERLKDILQSVDIGIFNTDANANANASRHNTEGSAQSIRWLRSLFFFLRFPSSVYSIASCSKSIHAIRNRALHFLSHININGNILMHTFRNQWHIKLHSRHLLHAQQCKVITWIGKLDVTVSHFGCS